MVQDFLYPKCAKHMGELGFERILCGGRKSIRRVYDVSLFDRPRCNGSYLRMGCHTPETSDPKPAAHSSGMLHAPTWTL